MKLTTLRAWTLSAAIALTAGSLLAVQPPAAPAPSTAPAPNVPITTTDGYTRVTEASDGTLTLEIATKTFAPGDGGGGSGKPGPKVHLVGAVHIGDKPYYEQLQKMLDAYDLVLFEGVKPPGAGAFDATLDEAGKIKATKARLDFLLGMLEENRSRTGKLPASLQDAADEAGKRWKMMIASSLTDAWGRPIQYEIATIPGKPSTDESGEPMLNAPLGPSDQKAVLTSLGADGASQAGAGDDVRVEGKAAPKKKAAKDEGLQAKMADALGLTFQLEIMDSSKPNWRSSDMSVDQLQARFEAAGVEGNQLFKMLDGSSFMGQLASAAFWVIKINPTIAAHVKLSMVEILGAGDEALMGAGGGAAGMQKMMGVILKDRNDVVLQDLRAVIDTETRKDIAIFYGAGHFSDMEAKLEKDFGYKLVSEQWLPAISINPKSAGMTAAQAAQYRQTIRKQLESQAKAATRAAEKAKAKQQRDENVQ